MKRKGFEPLREVGVERPGDVGRDLVLHRHVRAPALTILSGQQSAKRLASRARRDDRASEART